ncbi:MAG: Zn-ribbon-containing protein [Pirellulales bacterium]|nr:Zn-ribbon-containing protein [Pirellulales bacterium]
MFHIEVTFRYSGKPEEGEVSQAIYGLLASMMQNGQILDSDYPITYTESDCKAVVSCPEKTSLHPRHANEHVRKDISELRSHGLLKPKFRVLGRGIESPVADQCKLPRWYLLMTNYLSAESPLKCGEHYLPVPLYRMPPTHELSPTFFDILCWQREWKCCDELQMACGAGERFATKQISDPNSPLATTGRDLCRRIEKLSGVPAYYYLYRGNGRSIAAEQRRLCPSCGKKWLLSDSLHDILDFKCNRCRLVSNIAWSVRA